MGGFPESTNGIPGKNDGSLGGRQQAIQVADALPRPAIPRKKGHARISCSRVPGISQSQKRKEARMIIGDRLRELREDKTLSQGDIEKKTGLL